jgi:hypothetical protein
MSAVNTDLNRFAVFVNSKTSLYPSTTKNDVVIPFAANLCDTDPLKVMKVSIVDVLFSNVFYNIRPRVNKLKVLDVWAAGRGKAQTYSISEVQYEYGFYNYDSFTAAADESMGELVTITFSTGTDAVYKGFGSSYAGVVNNNIPASSYTLQQAKVFFQTPSLGDMLQSVAISGVTSPDTHSYIYAGKYLLADEESYGLLHLLGYWSNDVADAPNIEGTPYKGFGVRIYSRESGSTTQYSFDNVNWGTSTTDTTIATVVPDQTSDFTGLDDLYIHCSQLRTQFLSGISKSPLQPNDVVCVVPINVAYGEKMSFIPQFPLESFLLNTNITQLNFRMTNSNNEPLDFHGINWSLTMFCEEVDDDARIQAENTPLGALPSTFYAGGSNSYAMQQRLKQAKRKI